MAEMITPEQFKAAMEAMANSDSAKQKKIMKMLNTGLNLSAIFMDLGISGSQIREGQRLRGDIREPEMFTPTRDRSLLKERISDARRNIGDVSQDLAPAELANLDQYLADIGNARIASGGQASIFGAMGNAAALRRRRGGMQISALGSQIKRQNRGELNQLIGMDLADRSAYEGRKLTANELALQRYYKEAEEAGTLEATGRANRRDTIYNMMPSLSEGLGQLGQMNFGGIGQGIGQGIRGIGRGIGNLFNRRVPQTKFATGASPAETMDVFRNSINLQGY